MSRVLLPAWAGRTLPVIGMLAVPGRIDASEVRAHLVAIEGVDDVHDLHIWTISTTETALTAHLVMPGVAGSDAFLDQIANSLEARFGIGHSTIQVESRKCERCC